MSSKLRRYSRESFDEPTRRDELDFDELGHAHAQPESPNLDACDECSCAILRLVHVYEVPSACGV